MDLLMSLLPFIFLALIIIGLLVVPAVKVVYQYQRGVLFRFGRLVGLREPGLNIILPWIDKLIKVDLRTRTVILKPQEVITKDNVTVHVDAVVYFNVFDPPSSWPSPRSGASWANLTSMNCCRIVTASTHGCGTASTTTRKSRGV
jgi:regulator of protease activity HflC (stomatin/prohibitin superfamily)